MTRHARCSLSSTINRRPTTGKDAPRLDVYVSSECLNCDDARNLSQEAAARYPKVVVRVIDLDLNGSPPPDPVVAVPTYVLDGHVISLGNPYPEELFARLHEAG